MWSRDRFSNGRASFGYGGFRAFLPWGPVGGRQAIAVHRQDLAGSGHVAWIVLRRRRTDWSDDMTTIFRRLCLLSGLIPAAASAQPFQSHDAIDAAVGNALVGTGLRALPVDRRLKLTTCPEPLKIDTPAYGASVVHCASVGWRLRILVDSATATTAAPIVIKRGDPVSVNFVAPGFSVTTSGIAESEARVGERVRVRVEQKATPVMGETIDTGSVRVGTLN
jgi:flagellar basal body P-ring formation protein FlgA